MSFFDDIFGKKSTDEELKQIMDQFGPSKQLGSPALMHDPNGDLILRNPDGSVSRLVFDATTGQLTASNQAFGHFGITKEEQEELENLRKDHRAEVKRAKLSLFKGLSAQLRQSIIDKYEMKDCFSKMDKVSVQPSSRHSELDMKESLSRMGMYGHSNMWAKSEAYEERFAMSLPQGISIEDLKNAHMEASIEESLVSNETNS